VAADARGAQNPWSAKPAWCWLADVVECRSRTPLRTEAGRGIRNPDSATKMTVVRIFRRTFPALDKVTEVAAKAAPERSRGAREGGVRPGAWCCSSSFFRVGTSSARDRGNQFHAVQTGIEWSGNDSNLRLSHRRHAFIGCQDVAIQIEPDARILLLADPATPKVG